MASRDRCNSSGSSGKCLPCQAATDTKQKEPLLPTGLPAPWLKVTTDLFGLIAGSQVYVLVVKDLYSRYPAVEIVHSTSAKAVLPAMNGIMSVLRIPEYVASDNGPPYNSDELKQFARYMSFEHGPKIPLAPWRNRMVENFMHNTVKVLQTSQEQHLNWRQELQRFLQSYRATPHAMTGRSPAVVVFNGCQYRTRLPAKCSKVKPMYHQEIKTRDSARKQAKKNYADKKSYVSVIDLKVGDSVLCRQQLCKKV